MKHITIPSLVITLFCLGSCAYSADASSGGATDTLSLSSIKANTTFKTTNEEVDRYDNLEGASPEPTQAEELQESEELFQKKVAGLKTLIDDIGGRIEELRRQAIRPMQADLDRLDNDLNLAENELNSMNLPQLSPLTQLQRTQIQDTLFEYRLSIEVLNRRWKGEWEIFGLDSFQNAPPVASPDNRAVPDNYKIRKGDNLLIEVHSSIGAQNEYSRTVDTSGTIVLPGAGRITAAGRTSAELKSVLVRKISSRFRQLDVDVMVQSMSPIQVQVVGSATRPGTYVLGGLATVFNALYQAGGPKKTGSLRRISLLRSGHPTRNIDLYDFLLSGSKDDNIVLEDGDSIFINPVGSTIVVGGEVVRPARYEPDFPITLGDALKMAGGTKPGGYLKSVQVERVVDGEYRALLSETVGGADGNADFVLQPGDQVIVSTLRQDPTNQVKIGGLVAAPGMYGFSEGMRVSELIKMAQGLAENKEIYGGRADILRIEPFKGTEIIAFNLDKALQGDPKNDIELQKLDRVFIYAPDQVIFQPKLVTLEGYVARPGTYKRTGRMRISDAIAASGGVLPQAYLKRADLTRTNDDEHTSLIRVNLQAALNGDPDENIEIHDRDKLTIFAHDEVKWQDKTVRIEGAVQRPGVYTRSENMRISDLVFRAGGLLPEASGIAELGGCSVSGRSDIRTIEFASIKPGSPDDPLLEDRDIVTIPAVNPYLRSPEVVFVSGEVANPGPYVLTSSDDTLVDIVKRAGGLTDRADINGLLFLRDKATFEKDHQDRDCDVILEKSQLFADKQFLTQLAKMGVKLPEDFMLSGNTEADELTKPVEVDGDLKTKADSAQSTVTEDGNGIENTEDILRAMVRNKDADALSAMGPPMNEADAGSNSEESPTEPLAPATARARISVSLGNALSNPSSPDNLTLRNGDRVFVPRITNVVTVTGAVLHPISFAAGPGQTVDYFVERSGGYAQDAARDNVIVVRSNGDALPKHAVESVMPGDTIVVPNTGLIDIAKRWERMGSVTNVISDVLSSAYVLTRF